MKIIEGGLRIPNIGLISKQIHEAKSRHLQALPSQVQGSEGVLCPSCSVYFLVSTSMFLAFQNRS